MTPPLWRKRINPYGNREVEKESIPVEIGKHEREYDCECCLDHT